MKLDLDKYKVIDYQTAMSEYEEFGEFQLRYDLIELVNKLDQSGLTMRFIDDDTLLLNGFEKLNPIDVTSLMTLLMSYKPDEARLYECNTLRLWWD